MNVLKTKLSAVSAVQPVSENVRRVSGLMTQRPVSGAKKTSRRLFSRLLKKALLYSYPGWLYMP